MTSTLTPPTIQSAARETAALQARDELQTDTLSALDHRSRERTFPAAHAPAGSYLEFLDGLGDAYVMPLERTVIHVGRASAADLRIENPHVSRRHAIIVRHGDNVRLLDDRSSTGTFINGRPILTGDVHDGDVIRLGPVAIRYIVVR